MILFKQKLPILAISCSSLSAFSQLSLAIPAMSSGPCCRPRPISVVTFPGIGGSSCVGLLIGPRCKRKKW